MKKDMTWIFGALAILTLSILACDSEQKAPEETWSVDRSATSTPSTAGESEDKVAPREIVEGGDLNGVFLDDYDGLERVFITEKEGFSQADYKRGDDTVFTISVTDLMDEPELRTKYDDVSDSIAAHPYMARGKGSMVLVNDRFQVKISSKSLDEAARRSHLEKMNFSTLPK